MTLLKSVFKIAPKNPEPAERTVASSIPGSTIWRSLLRHLWCQHPHTTLTEKSDTMPAHRVCDDCGWREAATAVLPRATSTWDSTRDEDRYEREKKRRNTIESQRRAAHAQLATPGARPVRARRSRQDNVVEMNRTHVG